MAVDGVLCAIAAAFFLPLHIGSIPFPISALLAGMVNAALVWVALQWASAPIQAALPMLTWLATIAVLTLFGPGDDIVFGGSSIADYGLWFLLLVLGMAPPAVVLRGRMDA